MMTERQQKLLEHIIREFVRTAQPVASKSLEESGFLGVSSATIRTEMQELEKAGYLEQPHTSAGRVPSDKAYRYFVDRVVKNERPKPAEKIKKHISETLKNAGDDPRTINRATAQMLAGLCQSLVITGIVDDDDFFKFGLSSLFSMPEFREFGRAQHVADLFDQFDAVFRQIAESFFAGEAVRVFIGHESPFRSMRDGTVIVGHYHLPHSFQGSLTMIGPTRMNYERNLGLVRYTVEELNKIAKE